MILLCCCPVSDFPATLFSDSPSVPLDKRDKAKNSDRGNHKPAEAKETTDSASG